MAYLDNSGLAYFWGKVKTLIDAKAPKSHASTATTYGVANASKYGHAKASGTTPKALGTAAVGSETAAFARGDHVHPMPTAEQVGALGAGDTAENASKLGGKSPEYYTRPINLLDNSDFTNPVNQRGQTLYTGCGYTIDRWVLNSLSGDECALNLATGNVRLDKDSYIQQRFPVGFLDSSNTYTCAVWYADGGFSAGQAEIGNVDNAFEYVNLFPETKRDISAVALYKGEYTAETLPPYVPKGYATELMECQRYFWKTDSIFRAAQNTLGHVVNIQLPQRMRLVPTVIFDIVEGNRPEGMNQTIDSISCYSGSTTERYTLSNVEASADL